MNEKYLKQSKLRDVLADIYTDRTTAERVAGDAGLIVNQISFNDNAKNNWDLITKQALKENKLHHLIAVCFQEYGLNPKLIKAIHLLTSSENLPSQNSHSQESSITLQEYRANSLQSYPNSAIPVIDVLYLTANSSDSSIIKSVWSSYFIQTSNLGHLEQSFPFDIRNYLIKNTDDLIKLLNKHQPAVIHFSSADPHLIGIGSTNGNSHRPISDQSLETLFSNKIVEGFVKCVILDGCYSESQAKAILRHVDCVINISDVVNSNKVNAICKDFFTYIVQRFTLKQIKTLLQDIQRQNELEDTTTQGKIEVKIKPGRGELVIIDEICKKAGYEFAYLEVNNDNRMFSNHDKERLVASIHEKLGLLNKTVLFYGLKLGEPQNEF